MGEQGYQYPNIPEDARLLIQLSCTECSLNSQRNRNSSERSDTAFFDLRSPEEQKIFSEVQVKSHLWSVSGKVRKWKVTNNIVVYYMMLHVDVQPPLNAEESATLEAINNIYNHGMCFRIVPSAIPSSKYGPYEFICKIPLHYIISRGKLTLRLGTEKVCDLNCVIPMNNLLSYSKELFQNHELSDVTLKIRGKEFPAHKFLLSSFSPVFKTMFLSDFLESRSNVVEIKDFEFEVVQEMLKFIYTHTPPQFRSLEGNVDAISLYKASHKYDIQCLLESCRQELSSTINIESALDVLLLADIYEDAFLKEKALDFICKNPPAVDDVSKYEEMLRQRPGLMKDILTCKFKQK